ncbi:uncharacterized protein LOC127004074 isoform X2 [Eriocheir sinensis]|uniref:uncharacterized protein LOC127004074 isoform X2 n=1 Tax=Eriocheir sinensis TaxID=95602 RepID=UPI0021C66452|nr:uncharacterized protein LOC127004074 isoform X2 [Eriocheir sinensis]
MEELIILVQGHVNKDPWSVMDLSLEELTIEIVVEGKQREASSHPDKAAKCNGLLQQLMSYFSKESESEVSQVPTKDTVQDVSSKVLDESLLGNDSECLSKGKNSGDSDSEEKTVGMDGNQKLVGKNAQSLQTPENQFNTKNFSTESESDVSHAPATVMRQCIPLEASEGTSLENKYRKYSFEGRNLDFNDSEEKTTYGNGNQSMMGNSEQNLQALENQLSSKNKLEYSESEVSHVLPEDTVKDIPPKESDEALLDKRSGECLFKENLEISDCKEENACGDGTQNLRGNSGQNLHLENQGSTKILNPLNADETKLKDPSLKTFHSLPSELGHSQLNVIDESKYVMSMVQRNAQLVPGSCTDSALLLDINSIETEEHAPNVEIGSKSLFSEESNSIENKEHAPKVDIGSIHSFSKETGFVKQLYPIRFEEDVVVSSSEDEIKHSGDPGKKSNMKQGFDKQLVEAGNHSVVLENCGLNKENFSSEKAEHPSFSLNNVDVIEKTYVSRENHELETEKFSSEETRHPSFSVDTLSSTDKTALETTKTQCISTSDSALKIMKIIEWKSSWFDDDCDKNISDSAAVERERFVLTKPVTNALDQSCDSEVDSDSLSSSSSREASPLHFLNPPKWERVRNWIGYEDIVSVEEQNIENNDSSNPCPDFKSLPSSSMYFQSLVEDMDFDENFFQCRVQECPSETFPEHLKSSLFFGETASNDYSPSHVELSEEPLPEFKSCSKSNIFNMSLLQAYNNFAGSEPSAAYTQVPVPLPSSIAQTPPTSISNNIFPHSVSSILGGKMSGRKVLIIPKKSQVRHMVVTSHGMNSNLAGSALLSPNLQSPEHSEMIFGGKGVKCKKTKYVNKSGNHISSWVTETLPESAEEQPSCSTSEVTGIDCLAECVKGKLSCSHDFTNLFSEGEGREQDNHINSKFTEPDKSCENSVVSSHFPTLGTQHRESRLDETLETKLESKLHPTSYTSGLSNSDTSKQTSLCFCVSVGDDFKVCDCNTRSFEHQKDITVHCMEQTSHKIDIFCGSGADMSPTTSFDSDDEIHITVAGKDIDHHCSTQAGKESVTSDENCMPEKYLVNNHVNHSCYNDQSIETKLNENFMTNRNVLVNDIHVNQCHNDESIGTELNEMKECKASHLLFSGSELKRKADDQCEPFKKQRLHDRLTDIQIDEKSMHTSENHPKPTCTGQCGALMCGILDDSVLHDESCCSSSHEGFQDFATKSVSKKRSFQKVKTYTRSSKQCIATKYNENEVSSLLKLYVDKESAAGDDYSVCSSAKEITNLTIKDTTVFSHNSEFGSLKACPQYDGYSCLRVENDVNDLDFFQVASSYTGFLAPLISPTESLASLPESEQEERDPKHCVLQGSGSSQEGRENESIDKKPIKHKQSLLLKEIKQNTSGPALAANQDGLDTKKICTASHTGPQISGTNDISRNVNQLSVSCKDGELLNKSVCNDSIMFAKLGQNNNCNTTRRSSTHASGSQKLERIIIFRKPSQSFLSVPQGSNSFIKTSSTTTLVPNSPVSASTSPAVNTCGLPAALTVTTESHSRSLCVSGVAPHSRVMLPTLPSSQKKAPYPRAIASPSFPYSNFRIINFGGSGTEKEHPISCQKTALPNKYIVVPPALTSSDANASASLACQPLGSASMRGSSVGHSLERVDSPLDSLNHMKYDRELTTQNEKNSDTQEEGANMLKKVKLGSKGSFYLRPTPALKNAILEMRKKASESKIIETSRDYMTLPDGIPIPHPIFIPKRNEVQVVRHKKTIRKKRIKRVKDLVKEKVKESLESCNDEIPKMIVIYARRSFHICHIDVTETR